MNINEFHNRFQNELKTEEAKCAMALHLALSLDDDEINNAFEYAQFFNIINPQIAEKTQ